MNRLKKLNRIDTKNRDEAIVYINGDVYQGYTHAECINNYLKNVSNKTLNDTILRPAEFDQNEQNKNDLDFDEEEDLDTINKYIDSMAFAHKNNDLNAIFIETDTLQNVDLNTVINAIKEKYPTFDIYEDFTEPGRVMDNFDFLYMFKRNKDDAKIAKKIINKLKNYRKNNLC